MLYGHIWGFRGSVGTYVYYVALLRVQVVELWGLRAKILNVWVLGPLGPEPEAIDHGGTCLSCGCLEGMKWFWGLVLTWAVKVCKTMAFMAIILGSGLFFTYF